jgi:hypothetical protein
VLPGSTPRDVDYQFRCDGSRPGGTPRPEPTPTQTEAEPAPSPGAQTCNNNVIEGNEVCDGTALAGQTCESLGCSPPGGILSCRAVGTAACQSFNTDGCLGVGCNDTP